MANIQLTQELVKSIFYYKEGELYYKHNKSHAKKDQQAGYVARGYKFLKFRPFCLGIHRIIFLYHHGYIPEIVDHIDRNPLNNKIDNLRAANASQSQWNTGKKNKKGTSIYKGVKIRLRNFPAKRWQAFINIYKKEIYIGCFPTEQEAALAYNKKAVELFGEFACLNIIQPQQT